MIHEVMILDHSGPDLAMLQYAAGLKMTIYMGLLAALLNPVLLADQPWWSAVVSTTLIGGAILAVGLIESLLARLRMRLIPQFALAASAFGVVALLIAVTQSQQG